MDRVKAGGVKAIAPPSPISIHFISPEDLYHLMCHNVSTVLVPLPTVTKHSFPPAVIISGLTMRLVLKLREPTAH